MVPPALARLARPVGWTLVGLSLTFLGWQVWQSAAWHLAAARLGPLSLVVGLGALVYGGAGLLLAEAWRQLLRSSCRGLPAACYHAVYGRTQIAKYLPGNLFHFVGRQLLGRALVGSQRALALASLTETLLLIGVAAGLALPRLWPGRGEVVTGALLAVGLAVGLAAMAWPRGRWSGTATVRAGLALLLYATFFAVSGVLLWALARALQAPGGPSPGLAASIGAFALAWVAGFVTPGSSAGVGVREAVLVVALDLGDNAAAGALIALGLRLITVLGDVALFGFALALPLPPAADRSSLHPSPVEFVTAESIKVKSCHS